MNFRPVSLVLVVTLGVWSGLRAETPPSAPPAHAGKHAKPEKPETELEKTMSTMGKAWRQVRKEARDGQLSAATAKLVATVRTNAEAAGKLTPQLESERPEGERAKFHQGYQAQLKKLIAKLTDLEAALTAGDTAKAGHLIGEVNDVMKSGHQDYRKPDED